MTSVVVVFDLVVVMVLRQMVPACVAEKEQTRLMLEQMLPELELVVELEKEPELVLLLERLLVRVLLLWTLVSQQCC